MAKEKTIPELEKELAAALKQLEDSGKALAEVQAEKEKLAKSTEALSSEHEKELKTEKEAYSALELILQEERELAEDGGLIGESVSELEIVLLKNGIARHVYSKAEAKRWEAKGYTRKED